MEIPKEQLDRFIKNKTVKNILFDDEQANGKMVVLFTDGTKVAIAYDWIYGIDLTKNE